MKKILAESHRILVEIYDERALAKWGCQKWLVRFKSGDFILEEEERPRRPQIF